MSTFKSPANSSNKQVMKASSLISLGVLSSRFLGFIRDVVLANLLGTGLIAEAFFVAQRIPNLFRDLVGEGAANSAIVPVLSEYQKTKSKEQWLKLVNVLLAWSTIILTVVTVVGIVLTPWIVRLMAPGFLGNAKLYYLTVDLTRMMFPYLILVALTALQMGVLYTLNSFKAPAFSSCLLNISVILCAWIASFFSWATAYILAAGVLIGGILQLLWQRQTLAQLGVVWSWPSKMYHEGMIKISKLMMPRLWGSAVYQMNIFVDTLCASLAFIVGPGGIAAIYFANRLVQLPLGVFAYAISNASLPTLSALASEKDYVTFKTVLLRSLKNLLFVLLPSSVFLFILSTILVQTIFEHGAFDAYSTLITSSVLQYLSLGLPFFGASRILLSAFYALQDTKTPVRIATICLLLNVVLNVALMFPLKIGGIALASSISGMANFMMLYVTLQGRIGPNKGVMKKFFFRLMPCLIMMGSMMFLFSTLLSLAGFLKLTAVGCVGVLTYVLCCHFMKISEVGPIWRTLKALYKKSFKVFS